MTFHNWDEFWQAVIMGVVSVGLGVASMLLKSAFSYVSAKTSTVKDTQTREALYSAENEVQRVVSMVVNSLNQTVVNGLKSTNGGKLTMGAAEQIKDKALVQIKELISQEAQSVLASKKGNIEAYLSHLLEETVLHVKSYGSYSIQSGTTESTVNSTVPAEPDPAPVTDATATDPAAPTA